MLLYMAAEKGSEKRGTGHMLRDGERVLYSIEPRKLETPKSSP